MGAITMNVAANMLGLGNAATPFGIKAMEELERENPHPGTATGRPGALLRPQHRQRAAGPGQRHRAPRRRRRAPAADILAATLLASACATVAAVASAWALRRLSPRRPRGPRA